MSQIECQGLKPGRLHFLIGQSELAELQLWGSSGQSHTLWLINSPQFVCVAGLLSFLGGRGKVSSSHLYLEKAAAGVA